MALTYDLSAIKDRSKKYPDRTDAAGRDGLNEVTQMLIFISMITGIQEITQLTSEEVYTRIRMAEKTLSPHGDGYFPNGTGGCRNVTLPEVMDHIGLKTNTTDISKAKFDAYINRRMRETIRADAVLV